MADLAMPALPSLPAGPEGMFDPQPMMPPQLGFTPPPPAPVTAEGALSQRDPALTSYANQTLAQREQLLGRQEQLIQQQIDMAERKAAAMEPRYQALEREVAGQKIPEPPEPPNLPKPPTMADAQRQTWEQGWVSAAMFLAVLGGSLTRRPITNSLAAFAGMANGIADGQKEKFDADMKTWQAETKRAEDMYRQSQERFKNILERNNLSVEQKKIMMQIEAMRWQDQGMLMTAQQKGIEEMGHLLDGRDRFLGDWMRTTGQAGKSMQQMQWDQQARAWVNSPEGLARAQAIAEYRYPPVTTLGRTGYQGAVNQAIMDKVFEINRGYDDTVWEGKKAGSRVAGATDARVQQRTEIAFSVGRQGDNVRSLNVAIDHLDAMEKWGQALKNGQIQVINEMKNYLVTNFGGVEPTNLLAARQIVASEVIKAIANNGGGVTERQEAGRYLSTANSPEQIAGIAGVYRRLLAGQMNGLEQQYIGGGGSADNFAQKKLLPRTREAMQRALSEGLPDVQDSKFNDNVNKIANQMDSFLMNLGGQLSGQAEQITQQLPQTGVPLGGTRPTQSAIPGYSVGRGLPAGWSVTPRPTSSADMPIMPP